MDREEYVKRARGHAEIVEKIQAGELSHHELRVIREACDRQVLQDHGRSESGNYRLYQHLNRATQALRDAEDYARLSPGAATEAAARIRVITDLLREEVMEGRVGRPTTLQRHEELVKELEAKCDSIENEIANWRPPTGDMREVPPSAWIRMPVARVRELIG